VNHQTSFEALKQDLEKLKGELKATQEQMLICKIQSSIIINKLQEAFTKSQEEMDKTKEHLINEHTFQLGLNRFGLERFSSNDDAIRFYTGFPSYQHLVLFYNFVQPSAEKMTYYYASGIIVMPLVCTEKGSNGLNWFEKSILMTMDDL